MSDAYDMIDRFLRNNLGSDDDYAEYSKALDSLCRAQPAQAEARPCHVFNVTKNGALTEWEPTTMAFALPDGKHALYTAPQQAEAVPFNHATQLQIAYVKGLGDGARQAEAVPSEVQIEAACEAVAGALGDAYDCTRVWSAWSYGTMGPEDFSQVSEDSDRVREIALAALGAAGLKVAP